MNNTLSNMRKMRSQELKDWQTRNSLHIDDFGRDNYPEIEDMLSVIGEEYNISFQKMPFNAGILCSVQKYKNGKIIKSDQTGRNCKEAMAQAMRAGFFEFELNKQT